MTDLEAEMTCRDFVIRCLRALDDRDYDQLSNSFAEDGIWSRGAEKLVGPAAVREAMEKRPADFETQHLVLNMVVDLGLDTATVRYTVAGYAQTTDKPYHLHGMFRATDHLKRTAAGWRFVHRAAVPAFSVQG